METSLEAVLNSFKILLEKCGAYGKEFEKHLNKIREIELHIQAINQLTHDQEQPVEGKTQDIMIVLLVCKSVVYGPYIPAKAESSALTKLVNSMKIQDFPESIRPIGIEIKGYVDDIAAQLQSVDSALNEITEMMELIKKNQYNISKTERIGLKMKSLELESGLKICTNFQKQAAEALARLKSETSSYEKRQKDSALVKGAFAVLGGAGAGAAVAGTFYGLACAATIGGTYGYYSYSAIVSEYEKIVAETNKLRSALKTLEGEQKSKHEKVEEKKKKIDVLTE